ncbi:MAG: hypothetical protein M8357_04670 [Desulfobulbaceae bacterium]|nr:hypothetical protein [Desulfobulbaceae bacterium]
MSNPQKGSFFFFLLVFFFSGMIATIVSAATTTPGAPVDVQEQTGTVTGRFIVKDGESMGGGQVLFYIAGDAPPPKMTQYMRVPAINLSTDILPDGRFLAVLPAGKYYFSAIKRNSGEQIGQPRKGDLYYRYYKPNTREMKEFSITKGGYIDFGTLEARPWRGKVKALSGSTFIKGTVSDMDGNPVENCFVFAFPTPRMLGQIPLFVSTATGKDGSYFLKVAGDNTYFLMARDVMGGGQLQEGGLIGRYGAPEPIGVNIKTGEKAAGIDIKVSRMGHRGPDIKPGEDKEVDFSNIGSKKPAGLPSGDPPPSPDESK